MVAKLLIEVIQGCKIYHGHQLVSTMEVNHSMKLIMGPVSIMQNLVETSITISSELNVQTSSYIGGAHKDHR